MLRTNNIAPITTYILGVCCCYCVRGRWSDVRRGSRVCLPCCLVVCAAAVRYSEALNKVHFIYRVKHKVMSKIITICGRARIPSEQWAYGVAFAEGGQRISLTFGLANERILCG